MTTKTSVLADGSSAPETAIGMPQLVSGGSPSGETRLHSKTAPPLIRLAARSGSTAEATHMIDAPDSTRKVTRSVTRSGEKMEISFFINEDA